MSTRRRPQRARSLAARPAPTRTVPHRLPAGERARAQLLARRRRGERSDDGRRSTRPGRAPSSPPTSATPTASSSSPSASSRRCSTASTSASRADRILVVDTRRVRRRRARSTDDAPFPDSPVASGRDRAAPLHVGHLGRAEGGDRLAAPARPLRAHDRPKARDSTDDVGVLPGDADVPLERAVRRLVARASTSAQRWRCDRRFSASRFLPDVRRFRATYFNYVGKPLSYILATPAQPDDRDHTLVARLRQRGQPSATSQRFAERFGVPVTDNYGSTEGGVTVMRAADQPKGALGRPPDGVLVVDPETGAPRPVARVRRRTAGSSTPRSASARSSTRRRSSFEGYYKNDEADRAADPQRLVLVGRPRLRRRGRMVVLRRARLRLAARRRRELRRRARRTHRQPLPRRRARRGLRGARRRRRRRGDGRAAARDRASRSTRPRSTSSWRANPTSA